ncbi:arginine--tRNA ligase [Pectinatus sottacetonis]|uniref:arginine--tRNA ligase n=1 Tax=Pectinatus sottacetonis TaxID=1002795 RepID=UPI0018C82C6B|nr:arginine--tRNA ligase [Pectinatus sottacetonis]
MNIQELIKDIVKKSVQKNMSAGVFPQAIIPDVILEVPPQKEYGDFATNFSMQSARVFHMPPKKIAEELVKQIDSDYLDKIEIAGPGFINFYLKPEIIYKQLADVMEKDNKFGNLPLKNSGKIMVEYVSANPTGPLHVGHGRGAAYGSALVNLLRAAGYYVRSEYYINDAGNQIDNLAASVNARYLELLGKKTEFPENGYHGQDIIDTAKRIINKTGTKYLDMPDKERLCVFKELALQEKLAVLKEDLNAFNVHFDNWFSERTLHPDAVNSACEILLQNKAMYEKEGAKWLRSTQYGDDKDRVVIRDNGVPTYLASDIAYHKNKFDRGFDKLIDIWGADHHGYVCRVKASIKALGFDPDRLDVLLLQMVSLYRNGELVKMSKRTGQSVTLAELIEEVGTDAARYFFIMRSLDSQLDFDLDLAKSESNENPVYYVQYAHARICSIFRQAEEAGIHISEKVDLSLLTDDAEITLIKKILSYPDEIELAARDYAPHRIANYLHDLAADFHSFYNKCRIIGVDLKLGQSRLALAGVVKNTIHHALDILGISSPEKM